MRFPIDLIFVARSGVVLKVKADVPSRRIVGSLRAFAVIELGSGALRASGTQVGDRVTLTSAS